MRGRPRRGRARRRARKDGLPGPGRRRALESGLLDRPDLPHRDWPFPQPRQHLPERDAERRHLARVHGRRLRHRPAHRRRDVRRRRALVAGAPAAPVHHGQLPDGAVPANSGERAAHRPDDARPALERVHPLHRGGRGARVGPHHAGTHDPHHRVVVPRQHEGLLGQGHRRGRFTDGTRHPDDDRARRHRAPGDLPGRGARTPDARQRRSSRSSSSSSGSSSSPSPRASSA